MVRYDERKWSPPGWSEHAGRQTKVLTAKLIGMLVFKQVFAPSQARPPDASLGQRMIRATPFHSGLRSDSGEQGAQRAIVEAGAYRPTCWPLGGGVMSR